MNERTNELTEQLTEKTPHKARQQHKAAALKKTIISYDAQRVFFLAQKTGSISVEIATVDVTKYQSYDLTHTSITVLAHSQCVYVRACMFKHFN